MRYRAQRLLTALAMLTVLSACAVGAPAPSETSPIPQASARPPGPTAALESPASGTPHPTAPPDRRAPDLGGLVVPPGAAAVVIVDGLRVRSEPTVTAEVVARLSRGDEVFVTELPRVEADGLAWVYIQDRARAEYELGYVAVGDASGPFMEPTGVECPSGPVDLQSLAEMTPWARLVCFGSEPLTINSYDNPENYGFGGLCNCVAEPGWLIHPFAFRVLSPSPGQQYPWLFVRLAPGVEELWPSEPGQSLRVTGHFDDPDSSSCRFSTPDPSLVPDSAPVHEDAASVIMRCREQFVLTEIDVVPSG